MEQLTFEQVALQKVVDGNGGIPPQVVTPVQRWRLIVPLVEPPRAASTFQAVAAALANHADRRGGSCHPTIAQLMAETRRSERTVQSALADLEHAGLIVRNSRGGRGRATEYTLVIPAVDGRVDIPVDDAGRDPACTLGKGVVGRTPGPVVQERSLPVAALEAVAAVDNRARAVA